MNTKPDTSTVTGSGTAPRSIDYRIDEAGLIVESGTNTLAGYIFNFRGHGAFSPNGMVKNNGNELSQKEIDRNNSVLGQIELEAFKKAGRGMFYLTRSDSAAFGKEYFAGTWAATEKDKFRCQNARQSRHNIGRTRIDVDFYIDNERWHGINIGDNDILRAKRCKS